MSLREVKRRSNLPSRTREIASGFRPRNDIFAGKPGPRTVWSLSWCSCIYLGAPELDTAGGAGGICLSLMKSKGLGTAGAEAGWTTGRDCHLRHMLEMYDSAVSTG